RKRDRSDSDNEPEDDATQSNEEAAEPVRKKARKKDVQVANTPKAKDDAFKANYPDMNDQEILDEMWRKRKSPVYDHFLKPQLEYDRDNVVKYIYRCKSHPNDSNATVTRARYDTTTSNLVNHRDSCERKVAPPEQAITAYINGGSYNKGELRVTIALWVSRRHRPYKIVADPKYIKSMQIANKNVKLPCPKTVSRDVIRVHDQSVPVIAACLQERAKKNYLHLSFDGWTAANVSSFFGIVVHYADDDGTLIYFTLDFSPLRKRHTGIYLAQKVIESLRDYGIENSIFGLIGDNHSSNDKMIKSLETMLIDCPAGASSRVRCMGHVVNLVIVAVVDPFMSTQKRKIGQRIVEVDEDEEEEEDDADDE
ncbi:hypothetical protein K435DRAFT_615490, partial [Dendrothele bispora CBS 962.96]